ncbi:ribonuclease H-like domain-containing protein [Tanacetum coccineum]
MERKIDEWEKSQNISSEQTDRTEPPPPPQTHTEHVDVVFTRSEKSNDSLKIQEDPPSPIICGIIHINYNPLTRLERSIELGFTSGIRACKETLNGTLLSPYRHPLWEVIQKGNGPVSVSKDQTRQVRILPPKTAEETLARERERKARTTLLMAIPEDHLARFHRMDDAKEMWDAIKSRFGGDEGLHKGYDRFQSLLSKLEIHGAGVSNEDANQKFLRALPPSWSQISFVLRTKPGLDSLSFDDLYNNLRAFESDVKGSDRSSTGAQNVAFVSSKSTNSTNNVSTAYSAFTSSDYNSNRENSSSYADEVMHSFFATQSNGQQFDHEDLEQIDEFDLEAMDLKWQVAMISMRLKKYYKKTRKRLHFDTKEPVGFDKSKVQCFNCHKSGHFAKECRSKGSQDARRKDAGNYGYKAKDNERRSKKKVESKALLTLDGEGIDWTAHAEVEQEDFALMAHNNSGSDTEVLSCSNECKESYDNLKQLYDEQREQLGVASIKIQAYEKALKKVEAQLVAYQKNQLWSSDLEDTPENDRYVEGMHAVPSPLSGTSQLGQDDPHKALKNKGIVDSGCSRHMTGNNAYLAEYQDYNGGPVAFGGNKELHHFNLFSVSQMCDKKNKVLFTYTECLVLSPEFKLPDEN